MTRFFFLANVFSAVTCAAAHASSSYALGRRRFRASSHPAPSPASSTAVLLRLSCPRFKSLHRNKSYPHRFSDRLNVICKKTRIVSPIAHTKSHEITNRNIKKLTNPLLVRSDGSASCIMTTPALYMSKRSGLCWTHAALPAASATGPKSLRMSGASSLGMRYSSGGAYFGSMIVSSGAKFMPVRKHAHAPRSMILNRGSRSLVNVSSVRTRLWGLMSRWTRPARCTDARFLNSCRMTACVTSSSTAGSPLDAWLMSRRFLAMPAG